MRVAAIYAAPAKMIGKPRRAGAFHESFQFAQMIAIRSVGIAEVERDAVLDDTILLKDLIEHMKRPPGIDHVIL